MEGLSGVGEKWGKIQPVDQAAYPEGSDALSVVGSESHNV